MASSIIPDDLAASIADLTPIDWTSLEEAAADPTNQAVLARLRILDRVVRASAAIVRPADLAPTAVIPPLPIDPTVRTWGSFALLERISRNPFTTVYRAHDRRLDRVVTLTLLRANVDSALEERVLAQAGLVARVTHPDIATVYGTQRIDGQVGVWTEFIDGRSLADQVQESGPLTPDEVVDVGVTLTAALTALEQASVRVHAVTLHDVVRAPDGRLVLTALNISSLADQRVTATPVQSIGTLLYQLATGASRSTPGLPIRAYSDRLPSDLLRVIEKATRQGSTGTFATTQELAHSLARCRNRGHRHGWISATLLLAAALGSAFVVWQWTLLPPIRGLNDFAVPVPTPVEGLTALFAKQDRIYYGGRDARLHSEIPGRPETLRIHLPPAEFGIVDLHPQRAEFLIRRDTDEGHGELRVMPDTDDPIDLIHTRKLGDMLCNDARWSPDAQRIACTDDDSLFMLDAEGRNPQRIAQIADRLAGNPRWSPDGHLLTFIADLKDQQYVSSSTWEVRPDGTGLHQLLPGWNYLPMTEPGQWTADGAFYIFSDKKDLYRSLWTLRRAAPGLSLKNTEPIRLTSDAVHYSRPLTISNDRLMVQAITFKGELVRLNRNRKEFEPHLGGISATWVAYSPDWASVAYISFPEKQLWRMKVDGTDKRLLINSSAEVDGAAWSPDGKWIAFVGRLAGFHKKIFLMPSAGGVPTAIIAEDREQGMPSWSDDSTRIVFGDVPRRFGVPDGYEEIHVYDTRTKTIQSIPDSRGLYTARWSPDGKHLSALRINIRMQIMIFDVDTRRWRLLPEAEHVDNPTWSRDSRHIYYNTEGNNHVINRVRIADGKVELVADVRNYRYLIGWSGLTPDDDPMILHDLGSVSLRMIQLKRR